MIEVKTNLVGEGSVENHAFNEGERVDDLLEKLEKNPEAVVVKRNGKIVSEAEKLSEGDEIEIIPVVSGG